MTEPCLHVPDASQAKPSVSSSAKCSFTGSLSDIRDRARRPVTRGQGPRHPLHLHETLPRQPPEMAGAIGSPVPTLSWPLASDPLPRTSNHTNCATTHSASRNLQAQGESHHSVNLPCPSLGAACLPAGQVPLGPSPMGVRPQTHTSGNTGEMCLFCDIRRDQHPISFSNLLLPS